MKGGIGGNFRPSLYVVDHFPIYLFYLILHNIKVFKVTNIFYNLTTSIYRLE